MPQPFSFVANTFDRGAFVAMLSSQLVPLFDRVLGPVVSDVEPSKWEGGVDLHVPSIDRSKSAKLTRRSVERLAADLCEAGEGVLMLGLGLKRADGGSLGTPGIGISVEIRRGEGPALAPQIAVAASPEPYELLNAEFPLEVGLLDCARLVAVTMRAVTGAVGVTDDMAPSHVELYGPGEERVLAECGQYVRGLYWGLFLGPEQLRRLGGRERVLRDAPVEQADDLSQPDHKLVYLQATSQPDPDWSPSERLRVFFAPVLRSPTPRREGLPKSVRRAVDEVLGSGNRSMTIPGDSSSRSPTAIGDAPDVGARGSRLRATFKWEDRALDGEDVGPLVVWDPDVNDVVWESDDWVRKSDAKRFADKKGWQFATDG